MDSETLFIGGLILLLLSFVSFVSAWTRETRPVTAIIMLALAVGLLITVRRIRPQGLYEVHEVPGLIAGFVARVMAAF
jgi:hypothetical protein